MTERSQRSKNDCKKWRRKMDKKLLELTNRIYIIRNQKVMLDHDLADLYGVEVKRLNEQVKRNIKRFPEELVFQLDFSELEDLRSQIATTNKTNHWNHKRRTTPYAFTEAGSFALSFVLQSTQAIEMGLFIIRAFTHLRRFILKNENLMMELKNNDHLSTTFSNFEKRIEQDLIVLYKNSSKFEKRMAVLEERLILFQKILQEKLKI